MKTNRFQIVPTALLVVFTGAMVYGQAPQPPPSAEPVVKLADAPKAFQNRCIYCHETNVGPSLRGRGLDPAYVRVIVRNGSRAMPQFRPTEVDEEELAQLTTYLAQRDPQPVAPPGAPVLPGDAKRGEAVYQKSCVTCHGPKGQADGIVAAALKPPVIDFTSPDSRKKSPAELLKVIEDGKPGSAMPSWKTALSVQDIQDVLSYVLTLRK